MSEFNDIQPRVPSETLLDFLIEHPQENITAVIRLSDRFTKRGFKFTIRGINFNELEEYRQEARAVGNFAKTGRMDTKRFNELIAINHLVEPSLKDHSTLNKAGVRTSEEFLYKFFKPGEVTELVNKITELSGFDADEESAIEEVKD
jgi:hypothetical protein